MEKETLNKVKSFSKQKKISVSKVVRDSVIKQFEKSNNYKPRNKKAYMLDVAKKTKTKSKLKDLSTNDNSLYKLG